MKSIYDLSNVSANVVLNKRGEHVGTVLFHYGSGGGVKCEVHSFGNAASRNLETALKIGRVKLAAVEKLERDAKYCSTPEGKRNYAARELFREQRGHAGGYGYDKKTAALSGLMIDGHTMADHCGSVPEAEAKRARLFREYCAAHDAPGGNTDRKYWDNRATRIGARFANWCEAGRTDRGSDAPKLRGRYTSLHFDSGMDRLQSLGYRIISAI